MIPLPVGGLRLWGAIGVALVVIVVGIYIAGLKARVSNLKTQLSACEASVGALEAAQTRLVSQLEAQSAAVATMAAEAQAKQARSAKALRAAQELSLAQSGKISELLAYRSVGDECAAAKSLIGGELGH